MKRIKLTEDQFNRLTKEGVKLIPILDLMQLWGKDYLENY